jgi:hypothetical protein
MWEPQPLATLWASMACNRDIFTFKIIKLKKRPGPNKRAVGPLMNE